MIFVYQIITRKTFLVSHYIYIGYYERKTFMINVKNRLYTVTDRMVTPYFFVSARETLAEFVNEYKTCIHT